LECAGILAVFSGRFKDHPGEEITLDIGSELCIYSCPEIRR
jgi:hypothetical protein